MEDAIAKTSQAESKQQMIPSIEQTTPNTGQTTHSTDQTTQVIEQTTHVQDTPRLSQIHYDNLNIKEGKTQRHTEAVANTLQEPQYLCIQKYI